MRLAILLIVAVSVSAAQDPVPDTTDWHSYFPLEVGNEWQYHVNNAIPTPDSYFSRRVIADSLISDTTFFQLRRCSQPEGGSVSCWIESELLTYEDSLGVVVSRWEGLTGTIIYSPHVICRLDSPFGEVDDDWCFFGAGQVFVDGEYNAQWTIGGSQVEGTRKAYSWIGGGETYFSGIGHVRSVPDGGGGSTSIWYARVGGVEYGTPVVSNEAVGLRPQTTIHTYPNPARDEATLQFSVPEPQRVEAEVYDLRGVLLESRSLGVIAGSVETAHTFDVSNWPSGLYQIRLTGDGGFSATKGIIVIH